MGSSNPYLKSLWNYLINCHSKEELKQINNHLSVFLALYKLNLKEESGKFIYNCLGCSKSFATVPDVIKHLHIAHASDLFEISESGKGVIDLTLDENSL